MNKKGNIRLVIITIAILLFGSMVYFGYKELAYIQSVKDTLVTQLGQINETNTNIQENLNNLNSLGNLNQLEQLNKLSDERLYRSSVNDSLSNIDLQLSINNYDVDVDMAYQEITTYAKSLHTDVGNKIQLKQPQDSNVYINGVLYEGEFLLELDTISSYNVIEIYIEKGDDFRKILIPTLPEGFPRYEIGSYEMEDLSGHYYGDFAISGNSFIYKMDMSGNIVYYYNSKMEIGALHNFKKNMINDEVIYSYFEPVDSQNKLLNNGIIFGEVVLMDQSYEEINRLQMISTKKVPQAKYTENHDYIILDKDHYVLIGEVFAPFYMEDGTVKQMRCPYIQEIKQGKVIFEWLSKDYPIFDTSYSELGYNDEDYMHINSIAIDPKDNNFVISNRHQDSIVKINRKTGEIIWILGGTNDEFGLTEEQQFSRQHCAYFDFDGNLLFFNNDNNVGRTSIINFELNEEELAIENFKKYEFGEKFSPYCGNVTQISDNLLIIGWGVTNGNSIASIYNMETGKIVNELLTDYMSTYRTFYFE